MRLWSRIAEVQVGRLGACAGPAAPKKHPIEPLNSTINRDRGSADLLGRIAGKPNYKAGNIGRLHPFRKICAWHCLAIAAVSMVPGRITFAVIPTSPFSTATVFIRETIAALE